ncbi:MAG: histidine ammonia-lyase [Gammaproteobacteria bacterium]|nr:histidine ammonia-lyase [Gammaproteobacteria bacterium]
MKKLKLNAGRINLSTLREIAEQAQHVSISKSNYLAIDQCNATVNELCATDVATYGINTGFGKMAQTRIPADKLSELQHNLLLSHSCGVGDYLADDIVRLMLVLKILSLARGHSGVRRQIVDALLALLNHEVYPCIPEKGSVGASGDLAPLAHMSAVLLGVGEVRHKGKIFSAQTGLAIAGLDALTLGPKEGLALINGTQASTAIALIHFFSIEKIFAAATLIGALSVDAMKGSDAPFDPRIHELRGHQGQIDSAAAYRTLLNGSEIRHSHIDCEKVQDPYSLRCQPQVMGAILEALRYAGKTLTIEANAVTDNPLIFTDTNEALSGGNFHAEPVALVADQLAIAASEIGAIAERRIANLVDPVLSLLPAFLVDEPGLNSGFMIAQVTAAALASENKSLAHPASVDSLPTSANQEDHVSMATFAARRLGNIVENLSGILSIELLAAAQAIEFHRPQLTSPALEKAISHLRESVASYDKDRYFAPDIEKAKDLLMSAEFSKDIQSLLPSYA